jgi:hypothetical protein
MKQFESSLRIVQGLNRGQATRIEAGGYVWDVGAEQLREYLRKSVELGAREIYLAESLPFETKQLWKMVGTIVQEFQG